MDTSTALKCLIQFEKIKSAILCCQQCGQQWETLLPHEQKGAARLMQVMVAQIDREVSLAQRYNSRGQWTEVGKALDMAAVMISSGVAQEASFHLNQALRILMSCAEEAARILRREGLL